MNERQTFTACTCEKCVRACEQNPGWFTPEEARLALRAGLAGKLMRDWLEPSSEVGNDERIYVLAPAAVNYEGDDAPEWDFSLASFFTPFVKGRCTFLKNDRCTIHESGFKPLQCRSAILCGDRTHIEDDDPDSNFSVARLWNTKLGRAVVKEWRDATQDR